MQKHFYVILILILLVICSKSPQAFAQPQRLAEIPADNRFYISAFNNVYFFSGTQLWASDGTPEGTQMLKDIGEELNRYDVGWTNRMRRTDFTLGDAYFFFTSRGANGTSTLWASDGTAEGTVRVTSGWQGISLLAEYNDAMYVVMTNESLGAELYRVDRQLNTSLVADLNPGEASAFAFPRMATVLNDALLFVAQDGTGNALWKYTGNIPELVQRFPDGEAPNEMELVNNVLYFNYFPASLPTEIASMELWKTDGTPGGTRLVRAFPDDFFGQGLLYQFKAFEGKLYFAYGDNTTFSDLWVSDGTEGGTHMVFRLIAQDGVVVKIGVADSIMFIANMTSFGQPTMYYSDGTTEGTELAYFLGEHNIQNIEELKGYIFHPDHDGPSYAGRVSDTADASHLFRSGVSLRSIYGEEADLNRVSNLRASGDRLFFSRLLSDGTAELYVYEPDSPDVPADPPAVTGFVLVNADTNEDIMPIEEGSTIHMRDMPSNRLNIRAITSPAETGSVVFTTEGASDYTRTENVAPYAYRGDRDGNYHAWTPSPGQYSLTATPYTEASGQGEAGTALTLNFQIARAAEASIAIASFTLVNADSNEDIMPLTDGAVLNLQELPTRNLNVRANTGPERVGSVFFSLQGQGNYTRVESEAPYALAGDRNGNYHRWTPAPGTYVLTATPYVSRTARGRAGSPLSISFEVTDQAPASGVIGSIKFSAYPNPFADRVQLDLEALSRSKVKVEVFDLNGLLIQRLYNRQVQENQTIRMELDGTRLRDGVYLVKVTTDKEVTFHRLMLAR